MQTELTVVATGATNGSHELPVPSINVENYRGLESLTIPRFGRLNLIVGRNSTGKTALLEALNLFSTSADPETLQDILESRDELVLKESTRSSWNPTGDVLSAMKLFSGSESNFLDLSPIRIGRSDNGEDFLTISFFLARDAREPDGSRRREYVNPDLSDSDEKNVLEGLYPVLVAQRGNRIQTIQEFDRGFAAIYKTMNDLSKSVLVPSSGLGQSKVSEYWDRIALTTREALIVDALRMIVPAIERINLLGSANPEYTKSRARSAKVLLKDGSEPLPMKSLGDGLTRLFSLSLALANAADGLLLVDEIDAGLHYTVLENLWTLLLKASESLHVQVFATTHSIDCVRAFSKVMMQNDPNLATLTRLEERLGQTYAVTLEMDNLETLMEYNLEVR